MTDSVDLTRSEVQKIFDPVVDRIVNLVKQQVLAVERKGDHVAVSQTSISTFII